ALSGCSSSSGGDGGGGDAGGGASAGIVTVQSNEPQNPLLPAVTHEVGGGLALQNIFAGLVYYEADGAMAMDVAGSIASEDSPLCTIKLKEGTAFSDGPPVTAASFVNAWQYAASDAAFENQWWFANLDAYSAEGGEDTLALEVVDDPPCTVQLAAP